MSDYIVSNLAEYISVLGAIQPKQNETLFFRGQTEVFDKVLPSALRATSVRTNQRRMLLEFITESPRDFSSDKYTFDQLVRAQHYGLPTRLLDITQNPLPALFFASNEKAFLSYADPAAKAEAAEGEVSVYRIANTSIKFFDSDSVSCKANLSYLEEEERETLYTEVQKIALKHLKKTPKGWGRMKGEKKEAWNEMIVEFNQLEECKRLVQFIRNEKPYFEPRVDPAELYKIEVVLPKRDNARIVAQAGAFLLYGLAEENPVTLETKACDTITIPAEAKPTIMKELNLVGVSERTLYPELAGISKSIVQKYS